MDVKRLIIINMMFLNQIGILVTFTALPKALNAIAKTSLWLKISGPPILISFSTPLTACTQASARSSRSIAVRWYYCHPPKVLIGLYFI